MTLKSKIVISMLSTLLISTSSYAQIPSAGLIAHWPLNGNTNDISGNGHNGTMFNLTSVPGKLGTPNTAYLFNNVNSYITVPYSTDFNVTRYSICAIVKPNAFYTGTCEGNFILCRNQSEGSSGFYSLQYFDNAYNGCAVLDTSLMVFAGGVGPGPPPVNLWQSSSKVHTQNWYCVVLTYDSSAVRIYVNGILTCTASTTTKNVGTSTNGICIGKYLAGGSSYPYNFIGVLDDVAMYNRTLTPAEVLNYCNAIAPPDTTVSIGQPLNKASFCLGDTVHVKYQVTYPFNTANVFTAELSNSTGSFASPVIIGSTASTIGGTIICTIPAGTAAGTGYRIRVVGSDPSRTSADNGVNLTVNPKPTPFITSNAPVCEGDTIKITANYSVSGTTYNWTGPGSYSNTGANVIRLNAIPSMAGVYTVITTANGCKDTTNVPISLNTAPTVSITHNSPVCAGDTIQLTANSTPAASTYNWTGPGFSGTSQSVNILNANTGKAGKYIVKATLANGCFTRDTADIIVTDMTVNLGNDFSMCNNTQTVSLDIPGATYLWQDGSTGNSYHVTSTGTYYVTVSLNGCSKSDTINAKITYINMSLGNDTNLCPGTIFPLMVTDTFEAYEWNTGSTTNIINVNKQGMYWLQVNKYNCIIKDTIQVNYFNPYFSLGGDTLLCNGKYVNITAKSLEGSTYLWQDGHTGPSYTVRQPGRYWVKAENECGTYIDTISVNFEECDCRPFIASAFSPNGDGLNDEIKPIVYCPVSDYKFIITNRWGNIVFETANPGDRWNGTYKGRDAEVGTYFYYCILIGPKGTEYSIKGDITLVR